MNFQISKSTSNINDLTHGGRPKEEPHVKRSTKKNTENIEYVVRVDLVSTPKFTKLTTTNFFEPIIYNISYIQMQFLQHLIFSIFIG